MTKPDLDSPTLQSFVDVIVQSLHDESDWSFVDNPRTIGGSEDALPILENKSMKIRIRNLYKDSTPCGGKFSCYILCDGERVDTTFQQRGEIWEVAYPLLKRLELEFKNELGKSRDGFLMKWASKVGRKLMA